MLVSYFAIVEGWGCVCGVISLLSSRPPARCCCGPTVTLPDLCDDGTTRCCGFLQSGRGDGSKAPGTGRGAGAAERQHDNTAVLGRKGFISIQPAWICVHPPGLGRRS